MTIALFSMRFINLIKRANSKLFLLIQTTLWQFQKWPSGQKVQDHGHELKVPVMVEHFSCTIMHLDQIINNMTPYTVTYVVNLQIGESNLRMVRFWIKLLTFPTFTPSQRQYPTSKTYNELLACPLSKTHKL
jgi:hypothetical protein